MRFSRARYVTLCQQSLVTAAVLAVGLSAAGVRTLDIVPQPGTAAGAPRDTLDSAPHAGAPSLPPALAQADPGESEAATAPVTPKVREVAVASTPQRQAARQAPAPTKQQADPGYAETTPQPVEGYATVGVTWKHGVTYRDDQISIEVRTEDKGTWSGWTVVDYHDDHGPDASSSEEESARERPGTDALVIGDVDRVQMRTKTTDGTVPPDLRLAIIDPGTGNLTKQAPAIDTAKLPSATKGDAGPDPQAAGTTTLEGEEVADTVTLSALIRPAKPYIYSRAQWGANEKMREQSRPDYGTVKTGFVHHTVNANNYTSAQVPSLLRGIYAYHTQSRGWRDIGYNYLVDRFGRIWEGRWGGVNRAVVGAHTLGFNDVSFAMSAIGNFDIARPPTAVLNAFARLFAWKLAVYNIPASRSGIALKGRKLRAINGHRDVGQTACPGRYLYAQLGTIRAKALSIQVAAQKGAPAPKPTPKPTPTPAPVFTSPTQKALPARAQPGNLRFPRALNLSGPAYPDLVLRDSSGRIKVLETAGQIGYRNAVFTRGRWGRMSLLAAVNDVTGDGRGDMLGRIGRGKTKVYRGDGRGHVSRKGIAATRTFRRANKVVAAGDFNGDRRNDVLMRQVNGGLYLVRGLGAGRFAKPRLLAMGWEKYPAIAVPGDVTGDRRPDVVGVRAGRLYVFPNVGGLRLGRATLKQWVGASYTSIVAGGRDIDGGGVGDLLVRNRSNGSVGVRLGQTKSTFGTTLGPFGSAAGWTRISAGQLAGTPQADFVGVGPGGRGLLVKANNGLRNTGSLVTTNLVLPDASMVINAGDWNGDGKGDIIARDKSEDRLYLYVGLGNARYKPGLLMSAGWAKFNNIVGVGDVTGDGRPDLMGKVHGGAMTIFPGNGWAKFQAPRLAPANMRTFNQIGPGSWRPGAMPRSSFFGPGGGFVPYSGSKGRIPSPYNWVVGPGDVNGDGRADLVARDGAGTLWVLPWTASGYGTRRVLATGFGGYNFIG